MALTRNQQKAMFAKWGFDLTGFKRNGFQKVLDELKISKENVSEDFGKYHDGGKYRRGWIWQGDDIKIVTGNNPITGEYNMPKMREPEKDYASYIGIEGDKAKVLKAVKLIKMNKDYIKGESPNQRDFI